MPDRQRPTLHSTYGLGAGRTGRIPPQTRAAGGNRQSGWRSPHPAARRQQPKGRWVRRLRRLAFLAPLAALVLAGWWLYQSPWLRLQQVTVEGTRLLEPEYLAGVAGLKGDSILLPDTSGARRRLEQVPMVKSVAFERDWPRGIRIIVHERKPWGFWETRNKRYVIDQDGVVLERVLPDEGAPVIRNLDAPESLQPGERVDPDAVGLVRQVAEAAPQRLGLALDTAEYTQRDGLTIVFDSGLRVSFGDGRDFDYKMAALKALLQRTDQEGMEVHKVDLRFGGRIAFQ